MPSREPGEPADTVDSPFAATAPALDPAAHGSTLAAGSSGSASGPPAAMPVVDRATYEILGEHSRGGLGRILRARDRRTGRLVAIKEMLRDAGDAGRRFQREAMVTCNLQHPAIVPVYEVGRWPDGVPFYAMKLVAGRSLAEAIRAASSRADRLALLPHVTAAADALAYAHDLGIIHRDLKPANVLVGRFGETVVIDWGLAKDLAGAEGAAEPVADGAAGDLTMAGSLLGTPAYMSPEQARGEAVTERADVHALGAMLYHVLGGAMPYADAASADDILDRVRAGPPRPLAELDPELPRDLVAIASVAMAHDPADRYPSARELAEDLRRFATGQLVGAHDYSVGQLLARWIRRHRPVIAAATAAAIALVAVGIYSVQRVRGERDEAEIQRGVAERALGSAERANQETARSLARLHRDLGRQELDAGDPMRALAHLAESASRAGTIDPGLAYLAGAAADALESRRWIARSARGSLATLALSSDGAIALSASDERLVERWDMASGRRLDHVDLTWDVGDAALSSDGRWLAIAGRDLGMFDGASGRLVEVPPAEGGRIAAVAMSPVEDRVATGDRAGTIEIRRRGEREPVLRWAAHAGEVTSLVYTSSGAMLVSTGQPGDAVVWDAASGRRLRALGGAGEIQDRPAQIDAAGRRALLVASDGQSAKVFDLATGRELAALSPALVGSGQLLFGLLDPSGERALTVDTAGGTVLWDVDTARPLADLVGHALGLVVAAFSADRRQLATVDDRGVIRLWDARTGAHLRILAQEPGRPAAVLFTGGGGLLTASYAGALSAWSPPVPVDDAALTGHADQTRRIDYLGNGSSAVSGSRDGSLRIWDTATGEELRRMEAAHAGRVQWVAASPDGSRVASTGQDGVVKIWDPASGQLVRTLSGHVGGVTGAVWLPGGALASAGEDGTIRVWETEGAPRCASEPLGHPLLGLAAAPDGTILGWADGPKSGLWRATDCKAMRLLATDHLRTIAGVISPDGTTAVLGGATTVDATDRHGAYLVDLPTGAMRPLPVGDRLIVSASFDPRSARLATASIDGQIDLWDRRGVRLGHITGPAGAANAITFDGPGDLLLAGGVDGKLRVWDPATGELLSTRAGHTAGIYHIRLRADGRQVATAALEPVPHLWRIPRWSRPVAALVDLARCRAPWRVRGGALEPIDLAATGCPAPRE